jgi:predicted CXXCH cytochrome family protein
LTLPYFASYRLYFFLLTVGFFSLSITPIIAGTSCTTAGCHQDFDFESLTHPDSDEASCIDCHQGTVEEHTKEGAKLTLAADFCMDCHDSFSDRPNPHAPVEEGKCTVCHNPHGDIQNMLLPPTHPLGMYVSYDKNEYQLCFSCHKRELLRFQKTSFSTGFRDGDRNLHYLHVNKSRRGRNCSVCHDVHGSDQPKMIVEYTDFGNWKMKAHFKKSEMGGGCVPGCHRLKTYSRELRFMNQEEVNKGIKVRGLQIMDQEEVNKILDIP